ncbi:LysR family transcriptional regulator [Alicycliphilus denitrificans]|jgi:DNA-binding transcriptional LysR family regulator|uniref:LysR family transcriptional regulator n=1 Tax=Alicycliphilus denitrificans TaxID=179636 RepID=UPI000A967BE4|nr:LysR family transcriptional regulator [Alicycliphilus denitrificans]BCN37866.1 LysR family transcriptional regulator [Alicycliphilus denitrificans]HRO82593.1 LysR family transcriptional regulator [Alicycliphilus denitrificans]
MKPHAAPPHAPAGASAPAAAPSERNLFDRIDLHLIRVLHQVLTERSVSRAALRLGMHQPAVSTALKRLRELAGDPLLVRNGAHMVPTEAGQRMLEPAANVLRAAEMLFTEARSFDARTSCQTFRIAASDYLDPLFLPRLVADIQRHAPLAKVEIHALTREGDYRAQLALGEIDLVIGNWLQPPDDLHMARLFSDEVVSLVSRHHPAVRRGWDEAGWLAAEHIAPMPTHPGARGIIDQMLDGLGLQRHIAVRSAYFSLIPDMVAGTRLVLTTGRRYCERVASRLPLAILPCPIAMPPLLYYQLWHARSQHSSAARWLRERTREAIAGLQQQAAPPSSH